MSEYIDFNCPECDAPLKVWSETIIEIHKANIDRSHCERRHLIRHCENCHRDWENEWWTEFGDVGESQLKRKFWG